MTSSSCGVNAMLLQRYVDEELTFDQASSVRLHLKDCQSCRLQVQQLAGIHQALNLAAEPVTMPPDSQFASRVAQAAFAG